MKIRNITMDGQHYVLIPLAEWEAQTKTATMEPGGYTIEDVRSSLANKVITRRKAAGLSQADLARRAGVRVETISRLENGLHMPNARTFDKIDRILSKSRQRRRSAA